jgi:uncharacterized damage-inducible protein DinB
MRQYQLAVLKNIKQLCSLLTKEEYSQSIDLLSGSSIGQHLRHVVEFYQCLLNSDLEASVDYENRQRNTLIETLPTFAENCIDQLIEKLEITSFEQKIYVVHNLGADKHLYESSMARELYYLSEHTVHHFALIKIGIQTCFKHISLPKNFGVADSTVKHLEGQH